MNDIQESNKTIRQASIVVVAGVLATTLAQPQVLGLIPLKNLLKNELHVSLAANSAFFFLIGLPWYFKPLVGILTDAFPIFGTRRRSYMLLSTILAVLAWIALDFTPHEYNKLLWVCMTIVFFMVVASTAVGGYMVEAAQAAAGSGRLTAVREFTQQAASMIQGPAGGYLAAIALGWTTVACGGVMFLLFPAAFFFLHERRQHIDSRELLGNAGRQLANVGRAKTMWAAVGLMALFYIAPGFSTAIFYRQQNLLHLNTQAQGYLIMLGGLGGILAALAYGYACRRFNLRTLLLFGLSAATVTNLGYVLYSSFVRAQIIDGMNGIGYALAELVLMDLAVRATPPGSEGLGFSLMMSVRNLALFGTDWIGSKLLDMHILSFNSLVITNSATTFLAIPLVFLLPRIIVEKKDAELVEGTAQPQAVLQS